jgi:N6-L-threonylcarbamoyladenine synthase
MRILAIETSCDETAAAVVEDGRALRSHVVASQAAFHAKYGGIFPELAARMHVEAIVPVTRETLSQAGLSWEAIDAIAVTYGPGLPGSLVVGVSFAKALAFARRKPLIAVNHLEGHLYAHRLRVEGNPPEDLPTPFLALIVSGGHTELIWVRDLLDHRRVGWTIDDAAGEAFDKVARLLGLGFPGGPAIERIAREGDPQAFPFPALPKVDDPLWFSFSGLKTAVLRTVERFQGRPLPVADLAASFQAAVVEQLVTKTLEALRRYEARAILISGGVSANRLLRSEMARRAPVPVVAPPPWLCTDNAAMIGAAAALHAQAGHFASLDLEVDPDAKIGSAPWDPGRSRLRD